MITNGTFRQNLVYRLCGLIGRVHQRLLGTIAPTWRSADGRVQFVTDMPYDHLNNSYNMLKRRGSTSPMLGILFRELTARDRVKAKSAAVMARELLPTPTQYALQGEYDVLHLTPRPGGLTLRVGGLEVTLTWGFMCILLREGSVQSSGGRVQIGDRYVDIFPREGGFYHWIGEGKAVFEAINEMKPAVYDGFLPNTVVPSDTTPNDEDD